MAVKSVKRSLDLAHFLSFYPILTSKVT